MDKNIILIGFMGAGKTTLGKLLAKELQYNWVDLDQWIEQTNACSIPDLFEKYGEAGFRRLETEALALQQKIPKNLVSTGGGIVMQEENRVLLKKSCTIYLKWEFDRLWERIKGDPNRPLVKSYEQLLALYKLRQPLYEESAQLIVDCDELQTLNKVIQKIMENVGGKYENCSD